MALTDTLDDLISERRIEPQLAMKILANFDRSITEVLADKVKARLTFKVLLAGCGGKVGWQANEILY
jgi:transcription initiation factor TFIIA small subunit